MKGLPADAFEREIQADAEGYKVAKELQNAVVGSQEGHLSAAEPVAGHGCQEERLLFNASRTAGLASAANITSNHWEQNVKLKASGGHGFAAEMGNTLIDRLQLKDAAVVGGDNQLNGPDRLVDGVFYQSKYCATGGRCIASMFGRDGVWRYANADGTYMVVEVPKDKYDDALTSLRQRIANGQLPGVTDPDKAEDLVRRGNLTYKQAVRLTKAGTLESVGFDSVRSLQTAAVGGSLSALVAFSQSIWSGQDVNEAMESAAVIGLRVGGTSFAIGVVTSQLGRTGFDLLFRDVSKSLVDKMNKKVIHALVHGMTGKALTGAAATTTLAKLLRGNIATSVVTTALVSSADVVNLCRGRVSGSQLTKNVTKTATGTVAGIGGYGGGAALGTLILPGIGTVVGGVLGSLAAGIIANKASGVILDAMIIDDAIGIQILFERQMIAVANAYQLSSEEVASIVSSVTAGDAQSFYKGVYERKASMRGYHILRNIVPLAQAALAARSTVYFPKNDEFACTVSRVVDSISSSVKEHVESEALWLPQYRPGTPLSHVFHCHVDQKTFSKASYSFCSYKLRSEKGLKRLGGALNSYVKQLGGLDPNEVLFLYDSTVFGSGKEGFVITEDAIYGKGFLENSFKLLFEEIRAWSVSANAVYVNGNKVSVVCEATLMLLKKIGEHHQLEGCEYDYERRYRVRDNDSLIV